MTVADARIALLASVDDFGDAMCRCQLDKAKSSLLDIDDKIAMLIEAAKAEGEAEEKRKAELATGVGHA